MRFTGTKHPAQEWWEGQQARRREERESGPQEFDEVGRPLFGKRWTRYAQYANGLSIDDDTACCRAYTSVSEDGVLHCRRCFRAVTTER